MFPLTWVVVKKLLKSLSEKLLMSSNKLNINIYIHTHTYICPRNVAKSNMFPRSFVLEFFHIIYNSYKGKHLNLYEQ